ncbi:MAG: hypothetical protein U1E65_04470 [Myxococcota bacterium]
MISEDRPLDALIPGLRASAAAGGVGFFDATVGSQRVWVIALGDDPGGVEGAHYRVAHILEAALLRTMSTPWTLPEVVAPEQVHLFQLVPIEGDLGRAVSAFGFGESILSGPRWEEILRAIPRSEASPPLETKGLPRAWSARVKRGASAPMVEELERRIRAETKDFWGEEPGAPAARLLKHAGALLGRTLAADTAGLDALESLLVSVDRGVFRWIPPLVLQAVADLVGVLAHQDHGAEPAWSFSEPEEDGFVPPPVLRVGDGTEEVHVPILLHLVRWWVMPLGQREETPPPLSEWVGDQFAKG